MSVTHTHTQTNMYIEEKKGKKDLFVNNYEVLSRFVMDKSV